MYALSGSIRSAASNEIRVFVNQPIAPSAPANLLANVDGTSVTLAWRNTFEAGTPESVMLDVAGMGSLQLGRLTEVLRFTDAPVGTYTVSVRASNSVDESSPSNVVTLTIPSPCAGAPEAPAHFIVFREDNTLFVRWESPLAGPAPVGYTVTVTGDFSATITTIDRSLSGTVPSGTYNIRVRGDNSCGAGTPTAVQSVVVP
jgi:predicted phage tail protein